MRFQCRAPLHELVVVPSSPIFYESTNYFITRHAPEHLVSTPGSSDSGRSSHRWHCEGYLILLMALDPHSNSNRRRRILQAEPEHVDRTMNTCLL